MEMPNQNRFGSSRAAGAKRRCRAFTLIEAMLLIVILGITAGLVGTSMTGVSQAASVDNTIMRVNTQLLSQMETLRATWQTLLGSSTSYTNTATIPIDNSNYTMTTDIEQADPDGSGVQSTFHSLTVTIGDQSMTTYVSQ